MRAQRMGSEDRENSEKTEVSHNQGSGNMILAGFFNCSEPVTTVCFQFFPFLNESVLRTEFPSKFTC